MKPTGCLAAVTAVLTLGLCGAATAATPFTVGAGGSPNVAVAADGTAHVAWHNSVSKKIHYCRIDPGATTCAVTKIFDDGDPTSLGPPQVLIAAGGNILVVTSDDLGGGGNNRVQIRTSTNNGADFPGLPVVAGTQLADNAILSADGSRLLTASQQVGGGFYAFFQSAPITGSLDTASAGLLTEGGSWFDGDLALGPASEGSPLVVTYWAAGGDGVRFNRYLGGNDNLTASWSASTVIARGSDARTAGGAAGVLVMYKSAVDAGLNYVVRHYNAAAATWDTPAVVSGADRQISDNDVNQAPNGTFHAVYRQLLGDSGQAVRYMRPGFLNPGTLAVDPNVVKTRIAANDAGQGLAVWATSLNDNQTVRAARLDLVPGSGGPASNQPFVPPPPPPPPPPAGPGPIQPGPTTSTSQTFGSGGAFQAGLTVPRACIRLPNRFRVRATFRQIRTVRNRLLPPRGQFKAVRVQFRLDNKIKSTDKKPAFTAILSTLGLRAGTTHTVSARIYLRQRRYKVIRGRKRLVTAKKLNVRTLRAKIKVC